MWLLFFRITRPKFKNTLSRGTWTSKIGFPCEKPLTTFSPKKRRADSNDVHVGQDGGENDAVTKQSQPIIDQSEGKLDEILDRVKNIQISINESRVSPVVLPPMAKAKDMEPSEVRFKQLVTCRSIQKITNIFGEFENSRIRPVDGYVICNLCCTENILAETNSELIIRNKNKLVCFNTNPKMG